MSDPTAIPIQFDPREQRMRGVAYHGNTPFDVPYVSHISGNIYQGGCQNGLILPTEIKHVVSLYKWEQYRIQHEVDSVLTVKMYDAAGTVDTNQVNQIADWAYQRSLEGPTLIHCQAGLNRSSLVAGAVLIRDGLTGRQAVDLLREKRSPACLCNRSFEQWVLDHG